MTQKTLLQFIEEANNIHDNRYTYLNSVYNGARKKIIITCKLHGDFEQMAYSHLAGCGCSICAEEDRTLKKRTTVPVLINQFKKIHGNLYIYDKVNYINARTPIDIVCNTHGDFRQEPRVHLRGNGCPKCGIIYNTTRHTKSLDTFIQEAAKTHNDFYDYSTTIYINTMSKIIITCPKHGEFRQTPDAHLRGQWCSKCKPKDSKAQREINEFILSLGFETIYGDKNIIKPKELDIVIPLKKLAVEYNGLHWHHDKRIKKDNHIIKQQLTNDAGYELVTIFEDEWLTKPHVVKKLISRRLLDKLPDIHSYSIGTIDPIMARTFLNEEHINGAPEILGVCLGYFDETDTLISLLTLDLINNNDWNLSRIATNNYYDDATIDKLFYYFIENYQPRTISTISDNRFSDNKIYLNLKFNVSKKLPIDYMYIKSSRRYTKSEIEKITQTTISKKSKKIWDCGKTEWVWKRD